MTLPLPGGGVRVTVQRTSFNRYNDPIYTDDHQIDGCIVVPAGSVRPGETSQGENPFTDRQTLLTPPGQDILFTDRILIHPAGVDIVPDDDDVTRKNNGYQITGRPTDWVNPLTGWNPGMEIPLQRVS